MNENVFIIALLIFLLVGITVTSFIPEVNSKPWWKLFSGDGFSAPNKRDVMKQLKKQKAEELKSIESFHKRRVKIALSNIVRSSNEIIVKQMLASEPINIEARLSEAPEVNEQVLKRLRKIYSDYDVEHHDGRVSIKSRVG